MILPYAVEVLMVGHVFHSDTWGKTASGDEPVRQFSTHANLVKTTYCWFDTSTDPFHPHGIPLNGSIRQHHSESDEACFLIPHDLSVQSGNRRICYYVNYTETPNPMVTSCPCHTNNSGSQVEGAIYIIS